MGQVQIISDYKTSKYIQRAVGMAPLICLLIDKYAINNSLSTLHSIFNLKNLNYMHSFQWLIYCYTFLLE